MSSDEHFISASCGLATVDDREHQLRLLAAHLEPGKRSAAGISRLARCARRHLVRSRRKWCCASLIISTMPVMWCKFVRSAGDYTALPAIPW